MQKSPSPQIATGSRPEPLSASAAPTEMPGPAPDAAAALGADVIERMMKRPSGAVPGERQVGERNFAFADRRLERPREVVDPERAARRLVCFRPCLHR